MPVMNGYESTERIRSELPLQDQPVIVALTANAFEENKRQCLLSGMDEVITKPLQKKEIVAMLTMVARKEIPITTKRLFNQEHGLLAV
jgi:CheY-like chemotaxis protein